MVEEGSVSSFVEDERYEDAISALSSSITKDPPNTDGLLWKKGVLLEEQLRQPSRAVSAYQELVARFPQSVFASPARIRIRRLLTEIVKDKDIESELLVLEQSRSADVVRFARKYEHHVDSLGITSRCFSLLKGRSAFAKAEDLVVHYWTIDSEQAHEWITDLVLTYELEEDLEGLRRLSNKVQKLNAPLLHKEVLAAATRKGARARLVNCSWVVLILGVILLFLARWKFPRAVVGSTIIYAMLPLCVFLSLLAWTSNHSIAGGTMLICGMAVVTTFLCSRIAPPGRFALVGLVLVVIGVGLSSTIIAAQTFGILDLVVQTVLYGPEVS